MRPETVVVAVARPDTPGAPLNHPITAASTFRAGGDRVYGREGTATWDALEELLGRLEGGQAVTFGSGLAACAAALELVPVGGRVVAPRSAYYGVGEQLRAREQAGRLSVTWVETSDAAAVAEAAAGAAMVWLETPSNPLMSVADISAAASARDAGALLVVDSTFATPLLQQPLGLGADLVVHSATKYIGGHADLLLGAVIAGEAAHADALRAVRNREGSVPGALEAFLALRGARTLGVRLERSQANAGVLAERLSAHPAVTRVRWPGLADDPGHAVAARQMSGWGAMLAFEVADAEAAERLCARVRLITHGTSLGGVETMVERRARYAAEVANGTPEALLRLSVGIEHVEDLWEDLAQALT